MARHSKKVVRKGSDDCYIELVRVLPLRPIRSDIELDRAIAMIDSLIDQAELNRDEEDYLEVLSDLVHRYETEHDPIAPVPDAEMVRFLLESNDMTQAELAQRSKIAVSTISEILAEKRKLSRRHIAALSRVFRVSPAIFFSEPSPMTPERAAKILSNRTGIKISHKVLVSIASCICARFRSWMLASSPGNGRRRASRHTAGARSKATEQVGRWRRRLLAAMRHSIWPAPTSKPSLIALRWRKNVGASSVS